jgi:hypothetical protein
MPNYEPDNFVDKGLSPEVSAYLHEELQKIAVAFLRIENIHLVELHVEPVKSRKGMIVLADGSNWNPGSGAGFYGYHTGAWNKLG